MVLQTHLVIFLHAVQYYLVEKENLTAAPRPAARLASPRPPLVLSRSFIPLACPVPSRRAPIRPVSPPIPSATFDGSNLHRHVSGQGHITARSERNGEKTQQSNSSRQTHATVLRSSSRPAAIYQVQGIKTHFFTLSNNDNGRS